MGMKHYTLEQWDRYTGDALSSEERLDYEMHLSSCELCLDLYMQSLERASGSYPDLADRAGLADAVMEQIVQDQPIQPAPTLPPASMRPVTARTRPAFTRHPLFHYTVAAAITVILMGSGAFQSLTEKLGRMEPAVQAVEQEPASEQTGAGNGRTPVSYKIMEKTIGMLDSIQNKHEKGGAR
jgi:hypothetical protein